MQRLKFIRTASEKNLLFSFICIDSGIHQYIRHETTNKETIKQYEQYVSDNVDYLYLDDLDQFHVKMLADVIESIIGAILLDSYDIRATENAWEYLFESYLKKYADNPRSPPKRSFTKFCEETVFLKHFKSGEPDMQTLNKDQLAQYYNIEYKNSIMKYDFKYKGKVVFTRYYENSVKSKDKRFYKELLSAVKRKVFHEFKKIAGLKESYEYVFSYIAIPHIY